MRRCEIKLLMRRLERDGVLSSRARTQNAEAEAQAQEQAHCRIRTPSTTPTQ